jgi:hypothetical protein
MSTTTMSTTTTNTTPRRPLSFAEAADAHRAMTDAIRIVAMYANKERDAGNDSQADAMCRHLARLAKAQGPLCEYAQSF